MATAIDTVIYTNPQNLVDQALAWARQTLGSKDARFIGSAEELRRLAAEVGTVIVVPAPKPVNRISRKGTGRKPIALGGVGQPTSPCHQHQERIRDVLLHNLSANPSEQIPITELAKEIGVSRINIYKFIRRRAELHDLLVATACR